MGDAGKKRVGLVGLGSMARVLGDAIRQSEGLELVALCTRNAGKLAARAAAWGVQNTYTDYNAFLQDDTLDAVVVATPNHLHEEMSIAALQSGRHVLCEKPPALSADGARRMQAAAQASGRLLMLGLVFRFDPKYDLLCDLRERGLFGEFYYGKAGYIRRSGSPRGWFAQKALSGGGPLIDLGPHIIDLAMRTMGDFAPVSVLARTFSGAEGLRAPKCHGVYTAAEADDENGEGDVEQLASLVIRADSGAQLLVETSFAGHIPKDRMYMELLGTRGGVQTDPALCISTTLHGYLMDMAPVVDCEQFDYEQAIAAEVAHFADCMAGRCVCKTPPELGVLLMRVIDAAYRSAQTGQLETV